MRVLFLIPKNPPPTLEGGNFTPAFKSFVALCLKKVPEERPPAKELLKNRFFKNTRKTNVLVELIERRKRWLDVVGHVSSEDEEDKAGDQKNQSNLPAWQWDETIKGNPLEDKAVSDELARQERERKEAKEAQERRAKERQAAAAAGPKASPKPSTTTDIKKGKSAVAEKPAPAEKPAGVEKPAPAKKPVEKREPPQPASAAKKPVAAAAKKPGEKPSALTSVIHPALTKLTKATKDEHVQKSLEELKQAFDHAEQLQPGIVHNFIAQIIETLKSAS